MLTRIVLVATDGVSDGAIGITFDMFRAASRILALGLAGKRRNAAFDVRVVGTRSRYLITASGRRCAVDGTLAREPAPRARDFVIVPGLGLATPEAIRETFAGGRHDTLLAFLRRAKRARATVAASCSGTFLLAESGLLDGHEATTTWWLAPLFSERYPRVALSASRTVVASGRLLTAGSSFAHADLVLALIARAAGPSLAHLVARYLLVETRPSQARFMLVEHLRGAEPALQKLEEFVVANLAQPIDLADLSRIAGVSSRTLARLVQRVLGTTPMRFVQRIRAEHAARLLQTTSVPFEVIAEQVGYGEPGALRRVLKREMGVSPRNLRNAQLVDVEGLDAIRLP
jgi:transcriptional regulator GlxA family with amidase domain